jgi:hypothetical protein
LTAAPQVEPSLPSDVAAVASAATLTRPVEDFVEAQGSFGFGVIVGFYGQEYSKVAVIDYAGQIYREVPIACGAPGPFEPVYSGSVTERPLNDGRTMVHVKLHTSDAVTFVLDLTNGALIFGVGPCDAVNGVPPTLGESHLDLKFITADPPGSPMPDWVQLIAAPEPGQEIVQQLFVAHATGPLHEAFGVEEGTPGRLKYTLKGIHNAPGLWNAPRFDPVWPGGHGSGHLIIKPMP